jgi:diguanylate cyclase (GGDEF)-like protein
MAKVLVIDDHATNRALIVTLLAHRGHEALEAADGAEGLALVRAERPELVICDILMPTMDGFEFVRQLRADPQRHATEVVFYTAHYHEREARNLAKACGVSRILFKPCIPEEVLRIIDEAMARKKPAKPQPVTPEFDREHLRLMTDKLSEKVEELKRTNQRLTALTEINLRLASERDPHKLVGHVCRAARDLVSAKYGLLCVKDKRDGQETYFATSGFDAAMARRLPCPVIEAGVFGQVMRERASRRLSRTAGDTANVELPAKYPAANSFLVCPIVSLHAAYGWICLLDKLGADEFSEEDEQLLSIHAAQVGRIYENGSLYVEVERHAAQLQAEVAERKLAETKIGHLNRVHAVLSGINTLIVRVRDRDELFKQACEIAVEAGRFRLAWIGTVDKAAKRIKSVAWHGVDQDLVAQIPLGLDPDEAETYGIAGRVVTQESAIIVDDIVKDPRVLTWKESMRRGMRSLAVLPLEHSGKIVGVLALYAEEKGFFDEGEMKLLRELSGDISFALEHIAKEEKLNYLAYYDTLTGLANSTLFRDRLAQFIESARRESRPFAVALFDVDHFRAINDASGRNAGDQLLKHIATRLTEGVATPLECARLGADHFPVAMAGIRHEADAAHRVDAIHEAVFGPPYVLGDSTVKIAARAGVALYPNDGHDADTLLQHAEDALKRAKASGERSLFYAQDMSERIAERFTLENRLRRALDNDEFVLHYQPKVDLATRSVQGVEALIRWQSPEHGLVAPGEFISLLEETGLIRDVGAWALRRAVSDQRSWSEQKIAVPRIAVNVSAVQLRHRDFVEVLRETLRNGGQPPAIDIEITESLIMDDVIGTIEKLRAIRDMGVGIAIDDFGTGYSSLGYLARLPVHSLKIDRSFIVTMADDPDTMAIVSTIISLAHSLALKVIAEGVETEEQARVLRLFRCDEMQGYLISRPIPAQELVALLATEKA